MQICTPIDSPTMFKIHQISSYSNVNITRFLTFRFLLELFLGACSIDEGILFDYRSGEILATEYEVALYLNF